MRHMKGLCATWNDQAHACPIKGFGADSFAAYPNEFSLHCPDTLNTAKSVTCIQRILHKNTSSHSPRFPR